MKSQLTSGRLHILFGIIGIGYLYSGQIGKFFIALILSRTFLPMIWGVIRGIQVLSMTKESFNDKYNLDYQRKKMQRDELLLKRQLEQS